MSISSSCRNCAFADYDTNDIQVGCKAGRLAQFIQQGCEVRAAWDTDPDWAGEGEPPRTGKQYYLVARACNMNRPADGEWGAGTPQEEWVVKARKEVSIKVHAVVYAPKGTTVDAVLKTVRSLAAQSHHPAVTVVITANQPRPGQLIPALRAELGTAINWNVTQVNERNRDGTPVGRGAAVDAVVNTLRPADYQYYLAIDAGTECPAGLMAVLDEAVNDRLDRIVAAIASPEFPGVGPFALVRTHHELGGNADAYHDTEEGRAIHCPLFEDKLSLLVPQTGGLVRTIGEFCQTPG